MNLDIGYIQGVASSNTGMKPETLPPTESAADFHSRRVYFQVQEWKHLAANLTPTNWGWRTKNNHLVPVMTDKELAPIELLKIVRFSCKSAGCVTRACSCRKAGLPCVSACMNCNDNGCANQDRGTTEETDELREY